MCILPVPHLPSAVMQATPYQLSLLKTRLALVDDNLKNQGFIVGVAFSAADIQLVYTLNLAQVSNMCMLPYVDSCIQP